MSKTRMKKQNNLTKSFSDRFRLTAAFFLFIALYLILINSFRLLPCIDLPNHLAAATILRYIGEPGNQFSHYYYTDLFLKPNIVNLAFCSLSLFPSVEFASRIFLSLYIILLPLSVFFVIKKVGGNPWFALLSFALIINYNTSWGFVGYIMALPVVLFSFLATMIYIEKNKTKFGYVLCVLFILLFFIHVQNALFVMLLYVICCFLRHRKSLKKLLRDIIWILPSLMLTLIWWLFYASKGETGTIVYLRQYYSQDFLAGFPGRFAELVQNDFNFLLGGAWGIIISLIFAVFLIVLAINGFIGRRGITTQKSKTKRIGFAPLFFFVSLLCFLLLPNYLPGQAFVNQRLSVMVLIAALIYISTLYRWKIQTWVKIALCAVSLLYYAAWFDYYYAFNKENSTFTSDIFPDATSGNQRLAGLIYNNKFRGQGLYIHFPNYHIIWNRGITATSVIDYRFGTIRGKTTREELPWYYAWIGKGATYNGRYDNMEYILARGPVPPRARQALSEFIVVKQSDNWILYERKPDTVNDNEIIGFIYPLDISPGSESSSRLPLHWGNSD